MTNGCFLILLLAFTIDDANWVLKKEQDGILVYTRAVKGSDFEEFRAEVSVANCKLDSVLRIVLDVENYQTLFPDCLNPKRLRTEGFYKGIHYTETKVPWPLKNRDIIIEQNTLVDKNGKHAIASLKVLPDYMPEKKDIVRIRKGHGFWEITEDQNNRVTIIYQFYAEPSGDVPSWLANSFIVDHPIETLENLVKMLN